MCTFLPKTGRKLPVFDSYLNGFASFDPAVDEQIAKNDIAQSHFGPLSSEIRIYCIYVINILIRCCFEITDDRTNHTYKK